MEIALYCYYKGESFYSKQSLYGRDGCVHDVIFPNGHLPAPSQQWGRSSMVWAFLKAGNEDTRMTLKHRSGVFVVSLG